MDFPRIEATIEVCERHLDAAGARGTEVEAYLTRYALMVIYAEFEAKFRALVRRRCEQGEDPELRAFLRWAVERLTRSLAIRDISAVLGRFDWAYKDNFIAKREADAELGFSNLLENRMAVAHGDPNSASVTFEEMKRFYGDAVGVLVVVAEVLGVDEDA